MRSHIQDDQGRRIFLRKPPARIISLVPSDTYSLVRLGAKARLVGRTRYCVEPALDVADIPVMGGTKDVDCDAVIEAAPDLVIANQEENSKADVTRLLAAGLTVFVSFPRTMAEGVGHLARLARLLFDAPAQAKDVVRSAYEALREADAARGDAPKVLVFVPIWMDPLMTANGDTFLSDVIATAGGENVFADRERRYPLAADQGRATALPRSQIQGRDTRYPRITLDEIVARRPARVLLPDEPHPFTEADAAVFRALDIPAARSGVRFCDGKDLMWYGARSAEGLGRVRALLNGAEID